jgi:hypothetical protein
MAVVGVAGVIWCLPLAFVLIPGSLSIENVAVLTFGDATVPTVNMTDTAVIFGAVVSVVCISHQIQECSGGMLFNRSVYDSFYVCTSARIAGPHQGAGSLVAKAHAALNVATI